MKVGILTFHEGLNHGAYLQAFATMRMLQAMGHEVEIINYKNRQHWLNEDMRPWLKYRRPVRFIDRFKKQMAFSRDHGLFVRTSFTTKPEDVRNLGFDVVVVGSDCVWNYKTFGYDDLYFGGLNARRIISYAPSFGWVNAEENILDQVKPGLGRFDAISVRDENTRKIVRSLLEIDAPMVLDPTLVYDFSPDEAPSKRMEKNKPYLLVYAYTMIEETIRTVKAYAKANGLKTIATGYRQDWCDANLMGVGPLEWLTFYRNAHTVLTSTFHGAVFSLKYGRKFFYVVNDKAKNRVVSLLETCGMADALRGVANQEVRLLEPDYVAVSGALKQAATESRKWLRENLIGTIE
jgi:hypothetical protein